MFKSIEKPSSEASHLFSCLYCDKKVKTNWEKIRHERTHTKPFPCVHCERKFSEPNQLKKHERLHIGNFQSSKITTFTNTALPVKIENKNNNFNGLNENVKSPAFRANHEYLSDNGSSFQPNSLDMNHLIKRELIPQSKELPFKIEYKNGNFNRLNENFESPAFGVNPTFSRNTSISLEPNSLKMSLLNKKETICPSKKLSNSCQYCKKEFRYNSDKIRHEMIHTGEMPFSCDYCGQKFRRSDYLKDHKILHTGINLFHLFS